MAASLTSVGAITLFVEDPRRAQAFYEKVFDVTPVYEDDVSAAFRFETVLVNLLASSNAHELVEPARVADGAAGSRFQLTIWVDDADAACATLTEGGDEQRPRYSRSFAGKSTDGAGSSAGSLSRITMSISVTRMLASGTARITANPPSTRPVVVTATRTTR